jgi:alkanesulfonate monooxygenase SsuD/methylene tetrahydromethanopterin reductase-like flavin-dependent oxidoreductase (luciferase family)
MQVMQERRGGRDMPTARALGVGLTPLETRREVVLHVATRAEYLGYEAFYLAEGWGHDAGVLLAEVAVRTSRIRMGTGVLNVWGRSPATIAVLATTLDEVSGGRFTLGLGAGSPQLAEGLHDVQFTDPVARLGAVVRQVRRLLDGERLTPTNPGEHRPLRLGTSPRPDLPIHLGRTRSRRRPPRRGARRRLEPVFAASLGARSMGPHCGAGSRAKRATPRVDEGHRSAPPQSSPVRGRTGAPDDRSQPP